MPAVVVLDACVLYPLPLRDTLLRVARQNLYAVRGSNRILDEVTRNLIEHRRATPEQAAHLMSMLSLRVAPGRFGFVLRTSSTVSRPR